MRWNTSSHTILVQTPIDLPYPKSLNLDRARMLLLNWKRWIAAVQVRVNWEVILFAAAVVVYLLVRVIRLPDFPIYFFTDEAVQTILAQDFLRDGYMGYDKEFFPTYFLNSYQYNLGVSVYAQVLPYVLIWKIGVGDTRRLGFIQHSCGGQRGPDPQAGV
jgi:hypothetical protein